MKWLRNSMTIRMMMLQGGIKPLLKVIMQVLGISGLTKDVAGGTLVNGRSSVATVEDFEGNILDCLANEIRYKHGRRVDHGDGIIYNAGVAGIEYFNTDTFGAALATPMRILHEGAGENLVPYSDSFTVDWYNTDAPPCTILDNDRDSPLGAIAASKITPGVLNADTTDATNTGNRIWRQFNLDNDTYSYGIFIRSVSGASESFSLHVVNANSDDVVASVNTTADANWKRISVTGLTNGPVQGARFVFKMAQAVYVVGAQAERRLYPSSIIRTSGAPASRSADSINLPVVEGTNFVNAGGALVFDVTVGYDSDTTLANMLGVGSSGGLLYDSAIINTLSSSDATTTDNISATFAAGTRLKIAVAWSASESLFSINYSTDNGSTWQVWSQATYDGAFTVAAAYEWFKDNPYSNELHESTVYSSRASATLVEIEAEIEGNPYARYRTELKRVLSQYYTIPEVTLSGDFELEVEFVTGTSGYNGGYMLSDTTAGTGTSRLAFQDDGSIWLADSTGGTNTALGVASPYFDGKIHTALLTRVGSLMVLSIGGAALHSTTSNIDDFIINGIGVPKGEATGIPHFNGTISEVKIWDNGILIRHYKGDEDWVDDTVLVNSAATLGSEENIDVTEPANGGTYTDNGDGTFTVTGTGSIFSGARDNEYTTVIGRSYVLSVERISGGYAFVSAVDTSYSVIEGSTNRIAFTATEINTRLYISPGDSGSVTYTNLVLEQADGYGQAINITSADAEQYTFINADQAWIGQELWNDVTTINVAQETVLSMPQLVEGCTYTILISGLTAGADLRCGAGWATHITSGVEFTFTAIASVFSVYEYNTSHADISVSVKRLIEKA